jgi:hypothetical protein
MSRGNAVKVLILSCLLVGGCVATQTSSGLAGSGQSPSPVTATADLQDWPKGGLPAKQTLPSNDMKGYELYSARSKAGDWHYFLLPGTNRAKNADEILAAGSTVGADAIRARLAALPKESSVFWINGSAPLHLTDRLPGLGLPDNEATGAIQDACRAAGVILIID